MGLLYGNESRGGSGEPDREDLLRTLRAREEFLEIVLGGLESFVTIDAGWRLTFVNEAAAALAGRSREELLGEDLRALAPADVRVVALPLLELAMADRTRVQFEIGNDAGGRHLSCRAYPLADGGLALHVSDAAEPDRAERALRESEQRLRFHLENTPLAVVEWDAEYVVTLWAGEAEAMFGWSAAETVGRPVMELDIIFEPDIPIVERTMEKLSDGRHRQVAGFNRNVTKDGRVIHCAWYNSVLLDEQGRMASVMSLVQDLTEHQQALGAVHAGEMRQRFLLRLSDTLRELGDEEAVQATACRMLAEHLGADGCEFVDPDALSDEAVRRGEVVVDERRIVRPLLRHDELVACAEVRSEEPRSWTEEEVALVLDVVERAWSSMERAQAEESLRERDAERAAQLERARLARDLHDSVTQALFAATLQAESLTLAGCDPERVAGTVEEVARLNRGALAQMRTLLLELRGEPLEHVPLEQLMRYLAEATQGRTSTAVHLTLRGDAAQRAPVHTAMYRIAQESLNNAVRHARAGNVWITLDLQPSGSLITVEDDGVGFDETHVRPGSFGLRSMRERAAETGGELVLTSDPGGGTVVSVSWPAA